VLKWFIVPRYHSAAATVTWVGFSHAFFSIAEIFQWLDPGG
jgi:hypothetical protein